MKVIEEKAYKCSNCGHIYLSQTLAENCCKSKTCEDCGKELPYKYYLRICEECQEKRTLERSEHLTPEEYEEKYPNNMVFLHNTYYCSIEDYLTEMADTLTYDKFMNIKYIWGTHKYDIKLDFYHIVDSFQEDVDIEDFQMDPTGYNELKEFIKQWNKKYLEYGYRVTDIAIILSEEYMKKFWEDYHGYKDV